jgi:simple sugar transport system permease protein
VRSLLTYALALLVALAAMFALVLLAGGAPVDVARVFWEGTWGSAFGVGQVLFKTTALIFCGLSVALALRAGLFNIGVDGQLLAGAFLMALVGIHCPGPPVLVIPLALLAGAAGGALLGGFVGLAKTARGAHEVITTIMLNFIVRATLVGIGPLVFLRETVHTDRVRAAARLPRMASLFHIDLNGSALNASLILALFVVGAMTWMMRRTTFGLHIGAVGGGPRAAEASGISVGRVTVLVMTLSGAIAGIAGASFVLGYKYYFEQDFSGEVGFIGIAVAVLAGRSLLGVILAALLFGTLSQGAFVVNGHVPKDVVDVLQATVILALVSARPIAARLLGQKWSP